MVVIAIIALLIAILLPSLQSARENAKTVVCSTNLHHVGVAMAGYLFHSKAVYPPSYVYPTDEYGSWTPKAQPAAKPYGYMHWSYFMYANGSVDDEAFQCPKYEHGGAPRSNPGMDHDDWEGDQVDDGGQNDPNPVEDRQAPRLAYTANAAIMPRNKFTTTLSGGQRVNTFVRESNVKRPADTILATEFLNNWRALGIQQDSDRVLSKAHRPINPFYHIGSGFNEYKASLRSPGFLYGVPDDQKTYGLLPLKDVRDKTNILDPSSGLSQINAIGRHHPTVDPLYRERFGGAANFAFADGHVETMTALQSVDQRKWGDHYYSISGANEVLNMSRVEEAR